MSDIVRGTAAQARSERNGWVVGHFAPENHLGHTGAFEIKLWQYGEPFGYPLKEFRGTEFIVVYGGVLNVHVESDGVEQTIVLNGAKHEYIILPPGLKRRVSCSAFPCYGTTVRWPSQPNNQIIG